MKEEYYDLMAECQCTKIESFSRYVKLVMETKGTLIRCIPLGD